MALRVFPKPVRTMQASRPMRLRHELWHFVRAVWNNPQFPDAGRDILRALGWSLPDDRGPFGSDRKLVLDNFAGEDFLFMHRQMIAMTDSALAASGEPPISRWQAVPEPGDADFPVPPVWNYADPSQTDESNEATTEFLTSVKSDAYFEQTMRVRERFLTSPSNLRRLSLGALGNIAEMTIHNMMHMRWSSDPGGYRPGIDLNNPTGGDLSWDALSYDYLGDTYSSHVNPHFWYLHGWIDNLIERWMQANNLTDITWTGTWTGGPDLEPTAPGMEMMAVSPGRELAPVLAEEGLRAALSGLGKVVTDFPFPTTLVEIAREEGAI